MRLAWPPPWHLIASVLISIIALALIHLAPSSQQGTSSLLALILVLLIPGYLAVLSLFPGKSDLSCRRRALFCLITSLFWTGLFSFILTATPRGLQSASLATLLSLLAIFLAAVAYGRWSDLPRKRRFLLLPKRGLGSTRAFFPIFGAGVTSKRAVLAVLLLAACFIAALAFAFGPNQNPLLPSPEPFTELEVSWPGQALSSPSLSSPSLSSPSSSLEEGKELKAQVRVINHENGPMNYTLKLIFRNSALFSRDLFLGPEESWQDQISFMLTGAATSPGPMALDLLLYKVGNLSAPYKEERLWVNLSQNDSGQSGIPSQAENFTNINATENNSPVILEDKSKVTVLSAEDGSMGGGMKSSSSSTGSRTTTVNPASQTAKQPEKTESTLPAAASTTADRAQNNQNQTEKDNLTVNDHQTDDNLTLKDDQTHQVASQEVEPAAKSTPSPSSAVAANETQASLSTGKNSSVTASAAPETSSNLSRAIDPLESNQPPALKALVPDKASPQPLEVAIFWKAEAQDAEGDKILYKFLLDGMPVRKWSKINSYSWLTTGLPAGDYRISVQVIDGKHASEDSFDSSMNASFTLSRPNQAPLLQELKPDRASPQGKGGMITWTANASDPDNDRIYYKFMKNDEDVTDWSPSNSWIWNTTSEMPGDYRVVVLAKDGLHASKDSFYSSLEGAFTLTSPNSMPEVTDLKADRAGPQAQGTVITWTAMAGDAQGDAISYKFLVDDREVRGWSSSNSWIWDTSSASPGEYRIKALARDGKHALDDSFDSFKEAAVTIIEIDSNQPPALTALVPDIASPQVQGTTIIWKAEAQDPEGDKILYKFQFNGRDMSRWSESASWKWSSNDLAAGDYKIRVLARDGKHASEDSFDSSRDAVFTLISEIDQQIDQLMKRRADGASQEENYQSSDIQVTSGNGTKPGTVLGKNSSGS